MYAPRYIKVLAHVMALEGVKDLIMAPCSVIITPLYYGSQPVLSCLYVLGPYFHCFQQNLKTSDAALEVILYFCHIFFIHSIPYSLSGTVSVL